jgi:hypothetical protein
MAASVSKRPVHWRSNWAFRYRHVRDILINNRDRAAAAAPPTDWINPSHAHVSFAPTARSFLKVS